jgi:hypothetical protein
MATAAELRKNRRKSWEKSWAVDAPRRPSREDTHLYLIVIARHAFGGTIHALCKGRRTMACTITSLFLIAMFGIIAAGVAFRPGTKEKPSAQRQDTPLAPSGDRVIA